MGEMYRPTTYTPEQRQRNERREHPSVLLKSMLREQAGLVNERVADTYQLENLLNPDGSLDPTGYTELYGEEAIIRDTQSVRVRELAFSNAQNPRVQEFYQTKHGARTEDAIIAQWKENKSNEKNGQMEMAVTLLLSEMLGRDFLIVRTAPTDDYDGMDNLILDYVTGEVVGAFDEVHEGGDGKRTEFKKEKVQKIADRGGAKVRFGLKLENGQLKRAKLEGVPVFYLGLESAALEDLVTALREHDTEVMAEIFTKLIHSLESQQKELSKNVRSESFQAKLDTFAAMLERVQVG